MSVAPLSPLDTLVSIVDRPSIALADILQRPRWRWVLPVAVTVTALALSAILTAPLLAASSAKEIEALSDQLARLGGEQADQVQRQIAALQTPTAVGAAQFVTSLLGKAVSWLAQAGVLFVLIAMASADVGFAAIISATPWLNIPYALEAIVSSGYMIYSQQVIANQGLSYLASTGDRLADAANLAYVALSQVTVFRLWHLGLVYMLFRTARRSGAGSAFWLTIVYAVIFMGIAFAIAGLIRLIASGH